MKNIGDKIVRTFEEFIIKYKKDPNTVILGKSCYKTLDKEVKLKYTIKKDKKGVFVPDLTCGLKIIVDEINLERVECILIKE